jgi:hypothetical protein
MTSLSETAVFLGGLRCSAPRGLGVASLRFLDEPYPRVMMEVRINLFDSTYLLCLEGSLARLSGDVCHSTVEAT